MMGHPPAIPEGSFSTKLSADVDERTFNLASGSVPVLKDNLQDGEVAWRYGSLRIR